MKPGSLVLVTGVNGFIGSHIVDQLLAHGYHVRGTVRDVVKAKWMSEFFRSRHPDDQFELVAVPDMSKEGCYDEAVKGELLAHCRVWQLTRDEVGMLAGPALAGIGAAGVVHITSIMTGGSPQEVIPLVVAVGPNTLKSAAKEPSVMRFVYTSSSVAATLAKPNVALAIGETTYNEEAIQGA